MLNFSLNPLRYWIFVVMRIFIKILTNLIIAFCILGSAVFSIQNIEAVSIKFMAWKSISLPIGIILLLWFNTGLIVCFIMLSLFQVTQGKKKKQSGNPWRPKKKLEYQRKESSQEDWQEEAGENW